MKVLFVAPEVVPFAKTGGLADVAGALPKAMAEIGHEVRLVMPRYRAVDPKTFHLKDIRTRVRVSLGPKTVDGSVLATVIPGTTIPTYCIDQPLLFDREGLYQDHGVDFPDNLERFSFFAQATLEAIERLAWQPDVIHCHDWQTALVCAHVAMKRAADPRWQPAVTLLTIHNLAYQGLFPAEAFPLTGLPKQTFGIHGVEFYGKVNCLKAGLVYADMLTTVSPTYATEIQSREFGCGLEGVLQSRREDLVGILNGIDPEEWNPRTDPHLAARYGLDELAGKSLCKLALQKRQRLPERHGLVIGMVQRLAEQKGIDLFVQAAEELLQLPVQVVILGTGDPVYHEQLTALTTRFPDVLSVTLGFDNALAHQIEAGVDAFLMPSRFEPCGLNQMYSMRYGTVPIVRRVGGLADTVTDVSPEAVSADGATGFVFEEYTPQALIHAVKRAVAAFQDQTLWSRIVRTGMQRDFSWNHSAQEYVRVYDRALQRVSSAAREG